MKIIISGIVLCALLLGQMVIAQEYKGNITRIWPYEQNGGFVITVDSGALDNCKHKYAYYRKSVAAGLDENSLAMALSLALTALHSGSEVTIAADPTESGYCYAHGIYISK